MFHVKHFKLLPNAEVHENVIQYIVRGNFACDLREGIFRVSQVNGDEFAAETVFTRGQSLIKVAFCPFQAIVMPHVRNNSALLAVRG